MFLLTYLPYFFRTVKVNINYIFFRPYRKVGRALKINVTDRVATINMKRYDKDSDTGETAPVVSVSITMKRYL